ncbi:hypothetical protein M2103_002477 [Ereboglobus sp. PH5-5]|uniref:hypothetical protein n=1 Tax=Ereboglobus sp. PH5-5 TaxID=2940529 RepID=UPI002404F09F|nr:hypothetical protein [Ereboglobus sp. PH5-5]MDF9834235.1 hypothetical protein [Ereboglobus sp. PH5-5]
MTTVSPDNHALAGQIRLGVPSAKNIRLEVLEGSGLARYGRCGYYGVHNWQEFMPGQAVLQDTDYFAVLPLQIGRVRLRIAFDYPAGVQGLPDITVHTPVQTIAIVTLRLEGTMRSY